MPSGISRPMQRWARPLSTVAVLVVDSTWIDYKSGFDVSRCICHHAVPPGPRIWLELKQQETVCALHFSPGRCPNVDRSGT